MALERGSIVKTALIEVGEVSTYNDNRSETYQLASFILENILKTMAIRTDLTFNAITVKLTVDGENELGETRYNMPIDFLNKLRFVNGIGRLENEFIYSNDDELYMQYCRKIDLSEYPDYMEDLLVYMTALKLSESMNAFNNKVEFFTQKVEVELNRIYRAQFSPIVRTIEVV